ncbi:hypothetical protein Ddye_015924 [Dipteronia dyeriana]|uniref:Reverse transcriptase domain-containing protein n=1 Tax=Dipteronia dyeriana TaxID=168575 RepID=A0AAD9X003_9ROSI|nr:hypothetical protein Ddye_015924 [Dipteronia dyeriana]
MHVFGWPISTKVASLEWKVRSKVDVRQPRRVSRGLELNVDGNKVKKPGVSTGVIREAYNRPGSSYAKVVKVSQRKGNMKDSNMNFQYASDENDTERVEVINWEKELYDSSWLNLCTVGVFKKFSDVHSMIKRCSEWNIHLSSFYVGDKNILWKFKSKEERNVFIRRRELCADFFSFVGSWSLAITPQCRLVRVEFRGIPLNAWCEEFFLKLGWDIGEPLMIEDETFHKEVLHRGDSTIAEVAGFDANMMTQVVPRKKKEKSLGSKTIGATVFNSSTSQLPSAEVSNCRKVIQFDLGFGLANDNVVVGKGKSVEKSGSSEESVESSYDEGHEGLQNFGGESSMAGACQRVDSNIVIDLSRGSGGDLGKKLDSSFKDALINGGNGSNTGRGSWNLEEELSKVIEKGVAMGQFKVPNIVNKSGNTTVGSSGDSAGGWSLSDEVVKVIEMGCALGFDFNGKVGRVAAEIDRREKDDEARYLTIKALGRMEKRKMARNLVVRTRSTILFIQESKLNHFDSKVIKSLGDSYLLKGVGVEANGAAGGVITLWNEDSLGVMSCIYNNQCIILAGILSPINKESERKGGNGSVSWMRNFKVFAVAVNVIDLPLQGMAFTWSNNRENESWARLNRFLCDPIFLSWFPKLVQKGLGRSLSDHNPVILGELEVDWGPKPFHFWIAWLEDNKLMVDVRKKWMNCQSGSSAGPILRHKINVVMCLLKAHAIKRKSEENSIEILEADLATIEGRDEVCGWSAGLREERSSCLVKLWKQEGLQVSQILEEERRMLEVNFSVGEVWKAVCDCDGNKVPSLDGLNLNFIKANWDMIKGDFMNFLHVFYNDGSVVKDFNYTFIALIPKIKGPSSLQEYRPISLVGSLYKVLAKVLANRLKVVMDSVIGSSQLAFVKG